MSIALLITVKAVAKLNLGHRNKFEIEFYKISRRSSRSSDNAELIISRCCFAEDGKEMYKRRFLCRCRRGYLKLPNDLAHGKSINNNFRLPGI